MNLEALTLEAGRFADNLTSTVRAVVPESAAFGSTVLADDGVAAIRQSPDTGIPLTVDGESLLILKARIWCRVGGVDGHLKTDHSEFKVFASGDDRDVPVVRYDFIESPSGTQPAAHIQFHAAHTQLEELMAGSGRATRRGSRRAGDVAKGKRPDTAQLHFPVGGRRFRPCLEDVLEMLIDEFGVDHPTDAREALRGGREGWRRIQVAASVNDCPEAAIEELERLGYSLTREPVGPRRSPDTRPSRMREI